MAALEKLGKSLTQAIGRLLRAPVVDETTVKELVKDVQRALIQADVNVKLVLDLSKVIQERALTEKLPRGISRREHVIKVVYEELTKFLGEAPKTRLSTVKPGVIMLVGIQGSGKTTSAVKLARFFRRRGLKTALVCADTFRLGAFAQLRQLAEQVSIPVFGDRQEKDSVKVALQGVEKFRREGFEVIVLDTAGRHKDEERLIDEMQVIAQTVTPDEIVLVVDGTIGQQAASQAQAFHEATEIGSILITKLDGSARGGGALSAVAATGAPIKYVGTGERVEDLEIFVPSRFVGRLLGMGDLEGLVRKVREAEVEVPDKKAREILRGKFTLEDMYHQMEAMKNIGPMRHILKMIPGASYKLPDEAIDMAEDKLRRWGFILQSMTREEKENPRILNSSRVRRVARGSGSKESEVKELVSQYNKMRKLMKSLGRRRLPPALRKMFGNLR
jgi:signal recognition particle subunit SRP54